MDFHHNLSNLFDMEGIYGIQNHNISLFHIRPEEDYTCHIHLSCILACTCCILYNHLILCCYRNHNFLGNQHNHSIQFPCFQRLSFLVNIEGIFHLVHSMCN